MCSTLEFGIESFQNLHHLQFQLCSVPSGVSRGPGEGSLSGCKYHSQHLLSLGLVNMKGLRDRQYIL